jgi:alpha-glucosidase
MSTGTQINSSTRNVAIGNIQNWKPTSQGIEGSTEIANFRISIYSETTIRVQISKEENFSQNPYSVIAIPQELSWELGEQNQELWLKTKKIHLKIGIAPFCLSFFNSQGELLNQDDPAFAVSWLGTEVTNYKKVQPNEKFIGLGEKTGNLNRAGKAYTNWNTDYFGYGISDDPLYMSIPFYIGIHGKNAYGIFFDNTHKSIFNFGASNNRFIYYSAEDGDIDYYFIHDEAVSGIISAYSLLTGKMEIPPLWALGFQQCRYSYYPESEVITLADTFRNKQMPADVIYLDIHHMEKYKVFTFDGEKFPDPENMIRKLKEKGFKVVVIMDPGIKTDLEYSPYTEGLHKNVFVKYPDGEVYEGQVWPGWCAFPDFTHPETRKWWAEKMAFYTELGVDGYWTDMNEPASWGQFTPNLIEFSYEGEHVSHRKARNIYGMQMARSAQEGSLNQNPEKRSFVLTRAGFAGIQRYAAAWTGDNVASEEHMLAGIRLVNSLGISGVPFAGYDVGGFAGEATKSLFARWMSIATFAPLYRAHSMINSSDAEPWSFGEEVEEISRNYMKLRYRLLPLLYSYFYKSQLDGLPVAESLAISYAFDDKIYETTYQNEYLFCGSLLIAPIESTKEIMKVYLPEGEWFYLFNDRKYQGNQEIYVDCPLNYLPVFVKAGAMIPLQEDILNTVQVPAPTLHLHVYAYSEGSDFTFYEDDGSSYEYKAGAFYKRKIRYDAKAETLTFGSVEGTFKSKFDQIRVYFHGFKNIKPVLNGAELDLQNEAYAFLNKLTEFDPLPDYQHPYHEIPVLASVIIPNASEKFSLKIL